MEFPKNWGENTKLKYCYNCGLYGHQYKRCQEPVTSYGIILYFVDDQGVVYYLMIQRNFSPEYKEIIHNIKFKFEKNDQLNELASHLTQLELRYLNEYNYRDLYKHISQYYFVKKNNKYHRKLQYSSEKHSKLLEGTYNKEGQYLKLEYDMSSEDRFLEPDWGFPKGRRDKRQMETDIDCARREVHEETNIESNKYSIDHDFHVKEIFAGTNGISYQHFYYLGRVDKYHPVYLDPLNSAQVCEVRKIGWYTYDQIKSMIRPYHYEKKTMIDQVHSYITKNLLAKK